MEAQDLDQRRGDGPKTPNKASSSSSSRSKLAFPRLVEKANTPTAIAFLDELVEAVPYKVEVVLTDNGIQFADLPKNRKGPTAMLRGHPFDRACRRTESNIA